jgi:hypothetical protein
MNAQGAFFSGSFMNMPLTTDNTLIPGGTAQAQTFLILHELGHSTNALEEDANPKLSEKDNREAVKRNDKKIDQNCKKALKAAKK